MPRPCRALSLFALALFGCADDPTGTRPTNDASMSATASVFETQTGVVEWDEPWIECRLRLTAELDDDAAGDAYVDRIVFRVAVGPDRSEPVDSVTFSGNAVAQAFGSNRIEPGEPLVTGWYFRMPVPFTLTGDIDWQLEAAGDVFRAPFELVCGPDLPADRPVAPPVVVRASITNAAEVGPETPIVVDYAIFSGLGLWQTWLIITHDSGSDTIFVTEGLDDEAERQTELRFRPGSTDGSRFEVQIVAFDAWLRGTASQVLVSPVLNDEDPPRDADFYIDWDHRTCTPVHCQIASDSAIGFFMAGYDPAGLGFTRIRLGDPVAWSDSLWLLDALTPHRFSAPQGLDGIYALSASIADVSDNRVDFPDLGEVSVFPARGSAFTRELLLHQTYTVLPDFEAGLLYLVPRSDSPARVYDLTTLERIRDIALPYPAGAAHLRDGALAIAFPDSGTIMLDVGTPAARFLTIDRTGQFAGYRPTGLAVTSTGSVVVALNDSAGLGAAIEIDTASGVQTTLIEPTGSGPYDEMRLASSGDGSRVALYLASGCARIHDVASGTLTPCTQVTTTLSGDATGERWVTARTLYDGSLTPIASLARESGYPAAAGPTGSSFVATRRGLLRFDETTSLIRESWHAQEYSPIDYFISSQLHISPAGDVAVISGKPQSGVNTYQTLITVVDLAGP